MAEACKIREMRSTGNTLSWSGKRDHVWIQCRLDCSFGNDEWFRLFPQSSTEYMSTWSSDHRPLRIEFALEPESLKRGRFYFDKRMYGKRGVEEAIVRGWEAENDSPNLTVLERIVRCRTELAKLKKASDWNSKTQIEGLQNELDREDVIIAHNNVIIVHELVHRLRTNDTIGCRSMAVKTDMSKAYDRVEWNFLEVLLEKMGFDRRWISWTMSCISTVSFSILLNGRSHGFLSNPREG